MKSNLTFLTKLTAGGLVAVAIALWTQWLSGDPGVSEVSSWTGAVHRSRCDRGLRRTLVVDAADWRIDFAADDIGLVCAASAGDAATEPSG